MSSTTQSPPSLETTDLAPSLGTVVNNIDLSQPLEPDTAEILRTMLAQRQVLFFRDQQLSPRAQSEVARCFGETAKVGSFFPSHPDSPYVETLESAGRKTGTDVWHTDLTWKAKPPIGACLYAVDVPPVGGDTLWSSMTAAYESLQSELRNYLDGLVAVHSWEYGSVGDRVLAEGGRDRYQRARLDDPPITHPVVRRHPETGKKLIYVNALYTIRILGVSAAESSHLLSLLTGLAAVPEWQVRFKWEPGSVAIWDNRAVQHYAISDYHPRVRRMHRVSIVDDDPWRDGPDSGPQRGAA